LVIKDPNVSNYFFTNGTSLQLDTFGSFITNHLTTGAFSRIAAFLAPNNTGTRVYIDLGKSATQNNGGFIAYDAMGTTSSRFTLGHHGIAGELNYYQNGNLTIPGSMGIGTLSPAQKLHVNGGRFRISDTNEAVIEVFTNSYSNYLYTNAAGNFIIAVQTRCLGINTDTPTGKLEVVTSVGTTAAKLRGTPEALILDGTDYVFMRFAWSTVNKAYVGFGNASNTNFDIANGVGNINIYPGSGSNVGIDTPTPTSKLHVTGTARATNFTTNGTNTFTYASGTFTPRIAMFYTSDNKVYECNNPPAGKDPIAISYSVQTGVWVRVGNLITVNMEIQYSQTYSGVTFDVSNLNIVAVIPEDACKPNTLGAVGVTGYPSRIADRFVDNFQMNYWISNTSYAPGGTICEVQLRRDNTHNMMPWDPTNKSGQRVNITTSYYVLQ
jgi:hypothetical protein